MKSRLIPPCLLAVLLAGTWSAAHAGPSVYLTVPDDPQAITVTAVADGQADDTAAIQAAIDAAQHNGAGGIVWLPSGRYRITKSLVMWPGVRLFGVGPTRPVLVPLYRMFNVQVHDHFYTTSAEEKDRARGLGYVEEGIEGYCSASRLPGTEPLYRLFNAQAHDHFYTTSAAERDRARGLGYVEEEIACYVW